MKFILLKPSELKETLSTWIRAIESVKSSDLIYRSPEYFQFLLETSDGKDCPVCIAAYSEDKNELLGVIPCRIRDHDIGVRVADRVLMPRTLRVVAILGSIPSIPQTNEAYYDLLASLRDFFPESDGIYFQAVQENSFFASFIKKSEKNCNFLVYRQHGWRRCHTIPLPKTFDEYTKQFSRKKRYNINRQIRQLEEYKGKIELFRYESEMDVENLFISIDAINKKSTNLTTLSKEKYRSLARNGLMTNYALLCGDEVAAILLGSRHRDVLHVHKIAINPAFAHYSPGTSVLHLAIQDAIENLSLRLFDLGYGTTSHSHDSTNKVEMRSSVILIKSNVINSILVAVLTLIDNVLKKIKVYLKK